MTISDPLTYANGRIVGSTVDKDNQRVIQVSLSKREWEKFDTRTARVALVPVLEGDVEPRERPVADKSTAEMVDDSDPHEKRRQSRVNPVVQREKESRLP